jgi:predicted ester cyclase
MGLRERFEQMTEAWNAHEFDGVVTAFSEDCEVTAPDFTGKGHQGLRDWWDYNEGPFPDNEVVVHRTVLEGDTLVEESTFRGTNTGPLTSPDGKEIPPTGNRVEIPYVSIYTARGDQIVSWRLYWDQMAVMSQLGLLEQ